MSITQIIINSLIRASVLCTLSIGLTLVYDILKFANFAHVELAAFAAYMGFFFNVTLGWNIVVSAALATLATGVLAMALDRTVFKRLRMTHPIIVMIASFGLAIAIRNTLRAIWGPRPRSFAIGLQKPILVLGARITMVQILLLLATLSSIIALHLFLHKTRLGNSIRATSDNPELAQARGISTEVVIQWTWFVAGCFAGLAGVLYALETEIEPNMGFSLIIPVFCATILGGLGNPYGAMLGAIALGLAENFGIYFDFGRILSLGGLLGISRPLWIPTAYKQAIAFFILVVILLMRPSGILGRKVRSE
ncbi:MAG: branched-chain amino acid ABC transporter permease [Deltaproteobacteria bacterium]|nr:branched-chain amino acid ABC transporter permease [Deltaproteobacteria bacterium]MBW2123362.1 branched-chain amino acid ABC transporter permease [Deltaproteobacteria bacterium]